jgi:hypothetical protein
MQIVSPSPGLIPGGRAVARGKKLLKLNWTAVFIEMSWGALSSIL